MNMARVSLSANVDLQNYHQRIDDIARLMRPDGIEIFSLPRNYPTSYYDGLQDRSALNTNPVLSKELAKDIGKKLRHRGIRKVQYHYPWQKMPLDMNGSDFALTIQFCDIVLEESMAHQLTINYHNSLKYPEQVLSKRSPKFREDLLRMCGTQTLVLRDLRNHLGSNCLLVLENNPAIARIYDNTGSLILDVVDLVPGDFLTRPGNDGFTLDYSHAWLVAEYFRVNNDLRISDDKHPNLELCRQQYGDVFGDLLEKFVISVAPRVKWVHLCDEKSSYEHLGLHIGEGVIDFRKCAELLKTHLKEDVVATIEVREGHTEEVFRRIIEHDFPILEELFS